ncbi:MAG: hypothetical protein Kow0040_13560 [Thermogutta sp.]
MHPIPRTNRSTPVSGRVRLKGSRRRRFRRAILEALEPRLLLSGNQPPTLAAIPDVVVYDGAPLHVALDGFDPDGDALTYEVSVSNAGVVTPVVSQANRSLRLSVANYGDMVFQLFEDLIPNTTSRIIELAQQGFYDGLLFHRVINDFVIQTGDPTATGSGGSGTTFDDEFSPLLQHTGGGILAMAKSIDDSNDSQFYITAGPTRHLDFNHTVFGFLTEGEAVRHAIEQVPVDASSKPTTPVEITQATVFQDQENAVLRLIAPEGMTGQTQVTVTVRDGNGGEFSRTFTVTVLPDTVDNYPYLLPIDPIVVSSGGSATFQIPAQDVDGGAIYYAASAAGDSSPLTVNVDSATGTVTITAAAGSYGVAGIYVDVRAQNPSGYFSGRDVWDSQIVPVYITPPAPQTVFLSSGTDTGLSSSDGITNRDNSPGVALRFNVLGVVPGADVTLLIDGQEVVQAAAAFSDITLEVPESFGALSEGTHTVTVRQTLTDIPVNVGNFHSTTTLNGPAGSAYNFTIDKTPPVVTSSPPAAVAVGQNLSYDVQTAEEASGGVRYAVVSAPAGLTVHSQTGVVNWSPTTGQAGMQTIAIRATDAAGNTADHTFTAQVRTPPQVTGIPGLSIPINEGETLAFTLGTNGDPTYGPYRFYLVSGPTGMTVDESTGALTWTTNEASGPGTYTVTVEVRDSQGAAGRSSFQVVVSEVNTPPVLDPVADQTIQEGESLDLVLSAHDSDLPSNSLHYRLLGDVPEGMSIDPVTGALHWLPGETFGGSTVEVEVEVGDRESWSDPALLTDRITLRIHVDEVDLPPVWQSVPTLTVFPGDTLRLQLSAQDPDIPTAAIRYSAESPLPDGALLDAETGLLEWQIPEVFSEDFPSVLRFRATEESANGLSAVVEVRLIFIDPRAAVAPGSAYREADFAGLPDPAGNVSVNPVDSAGGTASRSFQPLIGSGGGGGLTPTRYMLFTGPGSGGTVPQQSESVPAGSSEQGKDPGERPTPPERSAAPNAPTTPRREGRNRQADSGLERNAVSDEILVSIAVDELLARSSADEEDWSLWVAVSSPAEGTDGTTESPVAGDATGSSDAAEQ